MLQFKLLLESRNIYMLSGLQHIKTHVIRSRFIYLSLQPAFVLLRVKCHINFLSSSHFIPWRCWLPLLSEIWPCNDSSSKSLSNVFLIVPFAFIFVESPNHLGKTILGYLGQLLLSSPPLITSPDATFIHLSVTSRDGESAPFLGSLFQALRSFSVKKFFPASNLCGPALLQQPQIAQGRYSKVPELWHLPRSHEKPFVWETAQHYSLGVWLLTQWFTMHFSSSS